MKGANYIPPDSFLPRVTHETYKRIVQDAASANMNMLRALLSVHLRQESLPLLEQW
jgi:beta-galactosidase/beta-glucuronidase